MDRHLLMTVHLHGDGMGTARFHGIHEDEPEWPPAPGRLFQALVAGAARGRRLPDDLVPALRWLEALPPPLILAPPRTPGQQVSLYVPNNDADALPDPTDVSGIRTAKKVEPSLFDADGPIHYAWPLENDGVPIDAMTAIAHSLYQLGRGPDMAWADVRLIDGDVLRSLANRGRTAVHQPVPQGTGQPVLSCPIAGTLDSLVARYASPRLRPDEASRGKRTFFTNAPKPRFASVSYARQRRLALYELRERGTTRLWPWPQDRAVALVEAVRDAAASRLRDALPADAALIDLALIGRRPDGDHAVPLAQRIRIVPLPSIGSPHVDRSIRRILVEVPADAPLSADDIDWAFSGLDRIDPHTGQASNWVLVRASELDMQAHYCGPSRHWQSVTAVALPRTSTDRHATPAARAGGPRSASARIAEERGAIAAVRQALRHAGIDAVPVTISIQREPFGARGRRADAFAEGSRFDRTRLWHLSIGFDRPVDGPLAIGDGRFVGLGVLAPTAPVTGFRDDPGSWTGERTEGVLAVKVEGSQDTLRVEPVAMARALRRAVMSRVARLDGSRGQQPIDTFFSGHPTDSAAADARPDRHLAYHWDPPRNRFVLLAPHLLRRRHAFPREREQWAALDRAVDTLRELGIGTGLRVALARVSMTDNDPLLGTSRVWDSVTPYVVTRHRRLGNAFEALIADVRDECTRSSLPAPVVSVTACNATPGRPLQGLLRLTFPNAITGPVALGRTGLLGGGLFCRTGREG